MCVVFYPGPLLPRTPLPCPGPSNNSRFFFPFPTLFCFCFSSFRGLSLNCGGLCAFSSLIMSSQHTFGLSAPTRSALIQTAPLFATWTAPTRTTLTQTALPPGSPYPDRAQTTRQPHAWWNTGAHELDAKVFFFLRVVHGRFFSSGKKCFFDVGPFVAGMTLLASWKAHPMGFVHGPRCPGRCSSWAPAVQNSEAAKHTHTLRHPWRNSTTHWRRSSFGRDPDIHSHVKDAHRIQGNGENNHKNHVFFFLKNIYHIT